MHGERMVDEKEVNEKIQGFKEQLDKVQADMANLNKNFSDFLDIIIPLLSDDLPEGMEIPQPKEIPAKADRNPMFG